MPKSYEMKLREAEERRRPRPKEEVYKAIEGEPQKILLGFDHPETLHLEMQLTWVEDTFTIDQTHDHLMSEVRRLDAEYRRKPLRCNYSKKYLWFDRFVMRPKVKGMDLVLQDYGVEPGFQIKVNPYYTAERMWGEPNPFKPQLERPPEEMNPIEDKALLVRLDKGPESPKQRLFCFCWMGGQAAAYIPVAQRLPLNVGCWALEMPGRGEREDDEGYPTGEFAIEVIAKTLAREMKRPGNNYFFAHSQGTHFAYYVAKVLTLEFNVRLSAVFVSNFAVPAALPNLDLTTLRARQNLCVPLRIFTGLIKGGWGTDPRLGYKSHMGYQAYQSQELWPAARTILTDWWITKDFPLPGSDEPLVVPIVAFYGQEDAAVSLEQVQAWRSLSGDPSTFEVIKMDGGHLWFSTSTRQCEALANELGRLIQRFG